MEATRQWPFLWLIVNNSMRWLITGDGWSRGEYPAGVWQVPGWVGEPHCNTYWRTAGSHPGVSHWLQHTYPDADVVTAGGVGITLSQCVKRSFYWCDWYQHNCTGIIFFWHNPVTDWNPFNWHSENWHGVEPDPDDLYYILPTNRWEHTEPEEFSHMLRELVIIRLAELNDLGIPIYMVGGSCSLPLELMEPYDNLIPAVPNARQLVWPDWYINWWRAGHMLKTEALYRNHPDRLNPINPVLVHWLHQQHDAQQPDHIDPQLLQTHLPDGVHGGRQLHKMIWQEIQKHLKNT